MRMIIYSPKNNVVAANGIATITTLAPIDYSLSWNAYNVKKDVTITIP